MSFFSEQTRIVEIDADNSVTVRKINYGQQQAAIGAVSKINPVTQEASIDFAGLMREQLIYAVVSWEGPGFDNRPVCRENVLALPPEIVEKIAAGVEALNKPLSDEEKKA